MKVKYPLSRLHCLSEASLQAAGFLAVMNFRITRVRNRERLFLLFFPETVSGYFYYFFVTGSSYCYYYKCVVSINNLLIKIAFT